MKSQVRTLDTVRKLRKQKLQDRFTALSTKRATKSEHYRAIEGEKRVSEAVIMSPPQRRENHSCDGGKRNCSELSFLFGKMTEMTQTTAVWTNYISTNLMTNNY